MAPRKKRTFTADAKAEAEEAARRTNVDSLAVLGAQERAVRHLEELVLGAVPVQEKEETPSRGDDDDDDDDGVQPPPIKRAAWFDEDDELDEEVDMRHRFHGDLRRGGEATMTKHKLQQRMRQQFQKAMGGAPSWATCDRKLPTDGDDDDDDDDEEEEEEDEGDDLLRRTGTLVASSDTLPGGIVRMKTCLHANAARPSTSKLTTVQFHPTAQVVLTAGLDCSLSLFQVDGKTNAKIQNVHLDRFPVHKACFSCHGDSVIATSLKNKMFYVYDMMEGRVTPVYAIRGLNETRVKEFSVCPDGGALLLTGSRGYLHTLTLKTKEVVSSVKMNGDVSGVAFSRDGSKLFANSEDGEVYVWDVRSSRCLSRFADEGCVKATSIAASPDGQYLACGSQAGVVNVYSQEACLNSANPKPLKAMMNLLTSATSLTFNPTSEILAMASRAEDQAVRLVHVASLSVFSNFPVSKRKSVHRASCLHFSPHSGFFSLANNKGHAPLFRLLHYTSF
uniref:U3 small nucleolar RNA-associated protein 18 homolog n=1 Tax=Doryrhamphus excisus TaxID=161450 RepID=UPI0025AE80CC|nr:U3 small nucleolar RNA-associated protein 18 homolog [Doryrhamphus excisus]